MIYIKIGKRKYRAKVQTFTTQFGHEAIRVISDAPQAHNGFLIVDINDNVISDRSAYTYLYRADDKCKEYTAVEETIIPVECHEDGTPTNPYDVLSRRITAVNNRVTAITPYEQSKKAYYGEIEKVFYGVPSGNLTVFFDNFDKEYTTQRIEDRVVITFNERLTDITNVTIMVQ